MINGFISSKYMIVNLTKTYLSKIRIEILNTKKRLK